MQQCSAAGMRQLALAQAHRPAKPEGCFRHSGEIFEGSRLILSCSVSIIIRAAHERPFAILKGLSWRLFEQKDEKTRWFSSGSFFNCQP
jgi:hypothetical protein